jgi:signal transduction histidine kinase/ActR/RegA family two-component response regulator
VSEEQDERILVIAPLGRDALLTCELLERAGLRAAECDDLDALCREAERGAAALLVAEEVLDREGAGKLRALISTQEPWSDLPVILFTSSSAAVRRPTLEGLAPYGNVTLLERPLRPVTMISAARAALRARRRQYETRAELTRQVTEVQLRDQFLAMLGHELRNPLSAMLLAVELIEGGDPDPGKHAAVIRRQGEHLARLVDDLLDVARVTQGKVSLRRQQVELDDVVARSVQSLRAASRSRSIAVEFRAPASPAWVEGDRVRLEQIVGNLLANAIKYSAVGGRVMLSVEPSEDEVVLRVKDEGVGIPPEVLPRVFDLFVQAERTLDRSQGGLGIGLTLVRRLTELHGGSVSATSAGTGEGSEFVVRLPLAPPAEDRDEATRPLERPARSRRVLVVEDNDDMRQLLAEIVRRLGHSVEAAADGREGLDRALSSSPDVVLLDLGLPELDGYEVARRLRARFGASITLIAVSGYGQPDDRRRAIDAGFDRHVTKPLTSDTLGKILASPGEHAEAR